MVSFPAVSTRQTTNLLVTDRAGKGEKLSDATNVKECWSLLPFLIIHLTQLGVSRPLSPRGCLANQKRSMVHHWISCGHEVECVRAASVPPGRESVDVSFW
jgi:hypothetical protein